MSKTKGLLAKLKGAPAADTAERERWAAYVVTQDFLDSYEWIQLRYRTLERYGARCMACGRTRHDGVVICVDHIESRRDHPEKALDPDNLQVLCGPCNRGKGNRRRDWRGGPDAAEFHPEDDARTRVKALIDGIIERGGPPKLAGLVDGLAEQERVRELAAFLKAGKRRR